MNLHAIVSGAIGSVNPFVPVVVKRSTGYGTAADGSQVPAYAAPQTIAAQVQAFTPRELTFLATLNISGDCRKVYVNGSYLGVLRPQQVGGDLFTFADGTRWLLVHVLEQWPDWCSFVLQRQL